MGLEFLQLKSQDAVLCAEIRLFRLKEAMVTNYNLYYSEIFLSNYFSHTLQGQRVP